MGLDITAISKIQEVREDEDSDTESFILVSSGQPLTTVDDVYHIFVNPHFVKQAGNLVTGQYIYDESMGFRAGSYSGYNQWRSQLAHMVNYDEDTHPEEGDFAELIYFSDCEGVITGESAKRLYQSFVKWEPQAREMNEYFYATYQNFQQAFELACNDGAVIFH